MKKYMGAEELLEHYKNAGSAAIKRMCDNEKVRNKMEENKTYCDGKDLLYMDSTQEKDMKAFRGVMIVIGSLLGGGAIIFIYFIFMLLLGV